MCRPHAGLNSQRPTFAFAFSIESATNCFMTFAPYLEKPAFFALNASSHAAILSAFLCRQFLSMHPNCIDRHKKSAWFKPKRFILMVAIGGLEPPTPGL